MNIWSVIMGFKVEFHVSVRGDIKISGVCLDGKTKTRKINGGAAGYGVCVWKFGCLLNEEKMK